MKTIYLSILAGMLSLQVSAQTNNAPVPQRQLGTAKRIANNDFTESRRYPGEKATGTWQIDYEAYEFALGQYETFVENSNWNDTTAFTMIRHYVCFDTLVLTPDGTTFENFSRNDVVALTVDSVFMRFHHQNTSGTNDTLNIRVIAIDAAGRPTTTILWSTQIITDTSLTGVATTQGYPVRTFAFPVAFTLPNNDGRFGIDVDYRGAIEDTFSLQYGYPTNGGLCGAGPDLAPGTSEFYVTSYYRVALGENISVILPTPAGDVALYVDCNGNGDADVPQENSFQNWSIWTQITLTEDVGIDGENGIAQVQVSPNPATGTTLLNFNLQEAAEATIALTDLSGKLVRSLNMGHQPSGARQYALDLNGLDAGVYLYRLQAGQSSATGRIVVQ